MTDTNPAPDTGPGIVAGVDGSDGAAEALRWAKLEADVRHLPLTALMAWGYLDQHHADGGTTFDPNYGESDARDALAAIVDAALGEDAGSVSQVVVCDLPAKALIDAGQGAEMVVVGARGLGGFKGLLLGSTSQHVLHHAICPVAVVRDDSAARHASANRIVVGVDGSDASAQALRWAIEEAQARDTALVVVHAWHMPYAGVYPFVGDAYDAALFQRAAEETLTKALDEAAPPAGLPVERRVVHGSPSQALLDTGSEADLVVVGARGLGGFAGLVLGSVSQHITRHARCPVIVIPTT